MLAKKFHLPIQFFNKTGERPKTSRNEYFAVKSKLNNLNFSRFGVVVSQKVSKSAVRRNKIKRIILNFVRLNKLHLKSNKDILTIVLPLVSQLKKAEIEKNFVKVLDSNF